MADAVGPKRIALRRAVVRIDPAQRCVYFEDGASEHYDVLISTLPVDRLVKIATMNALQAAASSLKASTVHVIGVGIEGATPTPLKDCRWIYFPNPSLPFYRASVLSNFSPANAPVGHWSLLAEDHDRDSCPRRSRAPDRGRHCCHARRGHHTFVPRLWSVGGIMWSHRVIPSRPGTVTERFPRCSRRSKQKEYSAEGDSGFGS